MALSANHIKEIKALQQKKFRKERGLFTVEGLKTVEELIKSNHVVRSVYATELSELDELVEIELISNKELERISSLKNPNTVLAIAEIPQQQPIDNRDPLVMILDGIRDPGNMGTIIRTAKWFGVNTIICSEDCADVYNPKVVQSTMGALFHVNVVYTDLYLEIEKLKPDDRIVAGAVMHGDSVYSFKKPEKMALVIGSESHGISPIVESQCDSLLTIPSFEERNDVESLNAAIATSIFLSELNRPLSK